MNLIVNLSPPDQFNNLTTFDFGDFISIAISFVLTVAVIAFFFMFVIGGIKWITSGGDRGKIEGARGQITAGLVGLVIVFAAWAILSFIGNAFHVNLTRFNLNFAGIQEPTPIPVPTIILPSVSPNSP